MNRVRLFLVNRIVGRVDAKLADIGGIAGRAIRKAGKLISVIFALGFILGTDAFAAGTVRWTGGTSTAWETAANWTTVSGTPSTPPASGDTVEIGTAAITNQPTITTPTTIAALTYGNAAASALTINGNLTISGAITNTIITTARIHDINLSSGVTLQCASATLSPNVVGANMTITFNGGTLTCTGAFTAQPGASSAPTNINLVVGTGTLNIGGTTLQGANSTVERNCSITVSTGSVAFTGAYTKNGNSSVLTFSGAATVTFSDNVTNTLGTFDLTGSTTTLNKSGAVAQQIQPTVAMTFGSVIVNRATTTAIVTTTGNLSMAGNLTVTSGIFDHAATGRTVTGVGGSNTLNVQASGTLRIRTTGTTPYASSYPGWETRTLDSGSTIEWLSNNTKTWDITSFPGNVIISDGTNNLGGNIAISGSLTQAGGDLSTTGSNFSLTVTGDYAVGADTLTANGSTVTIGGNFSGTGTLNAGTSTFVFNGSGAQAVAGTTGFGNYNNIEINKSGGTATIAAATTIDGTLTVTAGTFNTANNGLTVTGTTSISGTLGITVGTAGAITFGNLTLNSGGTFNNSTVNDAVTINGNIQNDGTFTAGTGVYTLAGASKTVSGANTVSIPSTTVTGSYTINVAFTVATNFTVSSGATVVSGSTITVNSGATMTVTGTFDAGIGTAVSGAGSFVLTSAATATLRIGSVDGIVAAVGTLSGNIQTTTARTFGVAANYTFNGTAPQNMGTGFPNNLTGILTLNNPGNTVTLDNARTIANTGAIDLTAGTFAAGSNLTMNATSSITRSGGSMTGTPVAGGAYNVTYTGTSKTTGSELDGTGLNNLTVGLTATNTLTLGAAIIVDGTITINAGSTLDVSASDFAISLKDDWTNSGTFTPRGGTVTFDGAVAQVINASQTFNNVVINKSANTLSGTTSLTVNDLTQIFGAFSPPATLNINGNFLHTAGTFTTGANTNVKGNWTRNGGTFTAGAGEIVTFNGSTTQTIGGSASTAFTALTIANTGGGTTNMTTSGSVSGVLTLTSDLTVTNPAILTQSGTSAGAGDVVGQVRRTDVGTGARSFGNLNVQIRNSVAGPITIDVTLFKGVAPGGFASAVTRVYSITGSPTSATLRLRYIDPGELNGNAEGSLTLWRATGSPSATWTDQGFTTRDGTNNWVEKTGVTAFSSWTLAAAPTHPLTLQWLDTALLIAVTEKFSFSGRPAAKSITSDSMSIERMPASVSASTGLSSLVRGSLPVPEPSCRPGDLMPGWPPPLKPKTQSSGSKRSTSAEAPSGTGLSRARKLQAAC